ncbi:MAG TPA: lysophospholipid acyltransferase family protein [Gemmatimonadales bacterium]|jgi:1-acyl-sn-glycerol-3-phosphate acyltransferase|nr:lysophospholipid acyltransferase family protein [Gemmatimonadales bacterium]
MLRIAWYYVVLVVSSVIHASGTLIGALLRMRHRPGGIYDWGTSDWSRWILRAAGTPLQIEGLARIPAGPVVYASNHSSMFDIWALAAGMPGSIRFVAKQELARIPLLGQAMLAAGHVTIDRTNRNRAMDAYAEAARRIHERGVSTVVFPEGTRSRTGELLPFKNAPFGLAIAAQVPLVPVYVHNTFRILPKGAWRLRPTPIRIWVGEPIPTTGLTLQDRETLRQRAHDAIAAMRARVDAVPPAP